MPVNINDYSEFIKKAADILSKGAFLTTKDGQKINTMTIGWGSFGFEWGFPTVEVMVRESRFTKTAMDKNLEFTLTFPLDNSMQKTLGYCGQKSGRDCDKIKDCDITIIPAKEVSTPVVSCKSIVMECKTITRMTMEKPLTSGEILDQWYSSGDLHTFYCAKVVACYTID